MNYALLADIVQETIERLVALGVSREVAEREMKGAEWAALQDITESNRDNQLLLCFEQYGWQACAKRYGVAERTIRDRRNDALNRQSRRRMAAA